MFLWPDFIQKDMGAARSCLHGVESPRVFWADEVGVLHICPVPTRSTACVSHTSWPVQNNPNSFIFPDCHALLPAPSSVLVPEPVPRGRVHRPQQQGQGQVQGLLAPRPVQIPHRFVLPG